jgi:hypothetical protein
MEKIYFDDTTFIWKTKLNLFDNKTDIIKQANYVIESYIVNRTGGFTYVKTENDRVLTMANCGKQHLLDKIIELGTDYCKELYIKSNTYNKLNAESWVFVINAKNPVQRGYRYREIRKEIRYHTHTDFADKFLFFPNYTFVYYIQMPDVMNEEDGVLYFKGKNNQQFWIRPEEDDLIIMEADMPHCANNAPNSTIDRIVLTGNVGFEFIKKTTII